MAHEVHAVIGFEKVAPFTLRVRFEDGVSQVIDFRPVLLGDVFGPLADARVFDQVRLDREAKTLVWPNGADFDPTTLTTGLKKARGSRRWHRAGFPSRSNFLLPGR